MKKIGLILVLLLLFRLECQSTIPARHESLPKLVYIKQPDEVTCGPTCAKMLMGYYGTEESLEDISKRCGTHWFKWGEEDIGMTHPENLALAMSGISARVRRGHSNNLKKYISEERYPIVLVRSDWYLWHYVIAIGYTEHTITIADPATGQRREIKWDIFLAAWRFTGDIHGNTLGFKCPMCDSGCLFCWEGNIDFLQGILTFAEVYNNTMIVPKEDIYSMKKEWILILLFTVFIFLIVQKKTFVSKVIPPVSNKAPAIVVPPPPVTIVVDMIKYPSIRSVSADGIGVVLADIESHMPAGHHFKSSNLITWAHETTHGINSNLRNKYRGSKKINAFYVLEDRAVIIEEPNTTIGEISKQVPSNWRGDSYNLYLVKQRRDWDKEPLYLFDEWVAYTNGAACRKDLGMTEQGSELVFASEFVGYALCLAYTVKKDCPNYDDKQLRAFLMWNTERVVKLGGNLDNFKTSADGEGIRKFCIAYFGTDWCKTVLGF